MMWSKVGVSTPIKDIYSACDEAEKHIYLPQRAKCGTYSYETP